MALAVLVGVCVGSDSGISACSGVGAMSSSVGASACAHMLGNMTCSCDIHVM